VIRVVATSIAPSPRVLEACAAFGLLVHHDASRHAWRRRRAPLRRLAASIHQRLEPGAIALLSGPSGCGKSTLLAELRTLIGAQSGKVVVARDVPPARAHTPILDLIDAPVDAALALLTRAGLADATLLVRTPCELSEGQRARLRLALAMHAATPRSTIIVDEFTSTLDRTTARCVAAMTRRWVRSARHRLVAATTRDDILDTLAPDVLIDVDAESSLLGACDA
jgi:ABC-type ATPase with predicted acetyltransferase domain